MVMTEAKKMYSFRLDAKTVQELDWLAGYLDREYERQFGRPPVARGNRTIALVTAVQRELDRQRAASDERRG
jgi:hypothetical protein